MVGRLLIIVDFFKLLIDDQNGDLNKEKLRVVIHELCGSISSRDRDYIIQKTFAAFGSSTDIPISEHQFVEVIV